MDTKLWNYKTTSENTGLNIGTLYALVSRKKIPHIRLGKRFVMFPVDEVNKWLDSHKVDPIDCAQTTVSKEAI